MKKHQNNSAHASVLQITLSVALISTILLASSFKAASAGASAPDGSSVPVTSLHLPTATITKPTDLVTVPVNVSEINPMINGTLQAFQGDFTFDSSVVTFQSTPVEVAGLTAAAGTTWSLAANVLGTDTPAFKSFRASNTALPQSIRILRVSCFSTNNSVLDSTGRGTQPLFNLKLVGVSDTKGVSTPLTWRPAPDNFIFFDHDGVARPPASTPPGSVTAPPATGRK